MSESFTGDYYENNVHYIVQGSYRIIPEGAPNSLVPDVKYLDVTYNVINTKTGKRISPTQLYVYVFIKDDATSIGDVEDQRIKPFTNTMFVELKRIVLEKYDSTKT